MTEPAATTTTPASPPTFWQSVGSSFGGFFDTVGSYGSSVIDFFGGTIDALAGKSDVVARGEAAANSTPATFFDYINRNTQNSVSAILDVSGVSDAAGLKSFIDTNGESLAKMGATQQMVLGYAAEKEWIKPEDTEELVSALADKGVTPMSSIFQNSKDHPMEFIAGLKAEENANRTREREIEAAEKWSATKTTLGLTLGAFLYQQMQEEKARKENRALLEEQRKHEIRLQNMRSGDQFALAEMQHSQALEVLGLQQSFSAEQNALNREGSGTPGAGARRPTRKEFN